MFKLRRKGIVLGVLGIGLLLLCQSASAAKIGYVVLSGSWGEVEKITSSWHELGKRFGYEVETVPSIIFSDITKTKEYKGFIINNVICFTRVEVANMERYVKEGGVIVAVGNYALNAFEGVPENHRFDPKVDKWNTIATTAGTLRCVIPLAMGAGGGVSISVEKIKFTIEHPLTKGLPIGEWIELKKVKGNKPQRFAYFGLIPGSAAKSLAQCQVSEDPTKTVDVFTCNEYGKGKGVWLGIPVDKAAEYDERIYLQLVENIFHLIVQQEELVKAYKTKENVLAKEQEAQRLVTLDNLKKQWMKRDGIIRIGIYRPVEFSVEPSLDPTPGATGIYQALKDLPDLKVEFIPDLKEETIFQYAVLILPDVQELGKEEKGDFKLALLNYVDSGFGMLLTHSSTGYKGALFNPLFSMIAQGVSENICRKLIVVDSSHPVTKGLSERFEHSYWNHTNLEPGDEGKVLIKDEKGNPVVIAGTFGKGRVVEVGSLIGRDDAEKDVVPIGDELRLLTNSIQWLSQGKKEICFLNEEKKIKLAKYLSSKFEFKAIYFAGSDNIPNVVKNLSRMGFNAILGPTGDINAFIEEGKKRNIGIYLLYSPFYHSPFYQETIELLKEHPEYKQIADSEFKGGKDFDPGWVCPDRPEIRELFLNRLRKDLRAYPGIAGISLDGIRDKANNSRGCFCEYSIKKRAEFVKEHSELSQEEAEREFNENTIVSFVEDIREIMKSVNPNLKLHGYTVFHWPTYKYKFPLDYHSRRAASGRLWPLSRTRTESEMQIKEAKRYHTFTTAAPMIDFAPRGGAFLTADEIRAQIRTVGKSGAKAIAVWEFNCLMYSNGEFKDSDIAKTISEEFEGNWWDE